MKPSRVLAILIVCAAEWLTGWVTHRSAPAGFDFIAIYASARLVATGQPAAVVDREAIFAVERATLPERDIYLNNPNPPALSLILAPIGALPFEIAYAVMLTLSVGALAAARRRRCCCSRSPRRRARPDGHAACARRSHSRSSAFRRRRAHQPATRTARERSGPGLAALAVTAIASGSPVPRAMP